MPMYDFKCDNPDCAFAKEEQRTIADRARLELCQSCHTGVLQPQVTAPARTPLRWGDTNNGRF